MSYNRYWIIPFAGLALLFCLTAEAAHIQETMTLSAGWNAIYLESTPTENDCEEFFSGTAVTKAQSYISDAYDSTAQYKSDGTEINQKPISFYQWISGQPDVSSLKSLVGGSVYLIYATNSCSKSFYGTLSVPSQSWRVASSADGHLNLAGVSFIRRHFSRKIFRRRPVRNIRSCLVHRRRRQHSVIPAHATFR